MMIRRVWIGVVLLVGLVLPAAAQDFRPRDVADGVATRIAENFFDRARADEIAAQLRDRAARGEFDAIDSPFAMADRLTGILAPFDGHFRVSWEGAGDGDETGPATRRYGFAESVARAGFGFREIAVLPGNIGYVAMTNFAPVDFSDPADPARRAADAALAMMQGTDAVIVDLRDNGGGAPSMVGYLASAFTPADADIYNEFHYRGGTASEAPAVFYPDPMLDKPLYILISARTASAGEALPYTLQAAGRARIVGEASAGGANPGGTFDAGAGFRIFVSTGSPVNPVTGGNWEGTGVVPDVEIAAAEALEQAQRLALRRLAETVAPAYRDDVAWALAALEAGDVEPASSLESYRGSYGDWAIAPRDGLLRLRQGRRPPLTLRPLAADLFYRDDDPLTRYRFRRDGQGAVIAVDRLSSDGTMMRRERG